MIAIRLSCTLGLAHMFVLDDFVVGTWNSVNVIPIHKVLSILSSLFIVRVQMLTVYVIRVECSIIDFLGWFKNLILGNLLQANQILILGLIVHVSR